ncbi:hypothetical protein YYG_01780 [Plasmodium vinckei petteri]|uniref:Uncharacterized protein n=1 Tax=Plasmodium vinckei petteri TaxID=138298 RepID=W7ALU7_PLAVN|nr:hypothetical protein YYG_01780 [Plasmodium vinckei petteri]
MKTKEKNGTWIIIFKQCFEIRIGNETHIEFMNYAPPGIYMPHVTWMKNTNKRSDKDKPVFQNIIILNDFNGDKN